MAGPDRPPPAGPRARRSGVATVYYPPPAHDLAAPPGPSGREARASRADEPTQAFERPTRALGRSPSQAARQAPSAQGGYGTVGGLRRPRAGVPVSRRGRLRRLGLWSVVKMSLTFYLCVFLVIMVAGTVLWNVAETGGLIGKLDKLVRSLFALRRFQLHPLTALAWGAAAVGALCLLGVLVNVVAAVIYNLLADLVGGVRVTIVSDEPPKGASLRR